MHKIMKIAKMEFYRTAMNAVFILLTLFAPFLFFSVAILPGYLSKSGAFKTVDTVKIGVFGADKTLLNTLQPAFLKENITLIEAQGSIDAFQYEYDAASYDGYLSIPEDMSVEPIEYISKNTTDFRVRNILEEKLGKAMLMRNFANAGIGDSEAVSILQPLSFKMSHLANDGTKNKSPDFVMILTISLIFASLLYLTIVFYGQVVGRSVLMEKTNKTVEILLSSVRPVDLLFGKLLGNAVASLLQYGVWIASSILLIKYLGPHFGFKPDLVLTPGTYLYLVLYFILAYFLYCSVYATLGSASRDEQQLSQLSLPVIIVLIIPVMLITAIIASPEAPVVVGLSLFPLTAPIVMFIRILLGAANGTQILISIILMLAAIAGCIALSTKIFTSWILLNGKSVDYESLVEWFRDHTAIGKKKIPDDAHS